MAIISFLFLVGETVILIDIGYSWGERWKELYDSGQNGYGNLLVAFTFFIYAGVIGVLGLEFGYFQGATNVAVIVVFLIAGILFISFSCYCFLDYHFRL
jgi:hypothetical protein